MRDRGEGMRAVTVKAVTAPGTVQVITAPCRLCGWSLQAGDAAGTSATGAVTSPGAGAVIASLGTLPPGDYTVSWQVTLAGAAAAGDLNNFALQVAGVTVATSDNPGAAGTYPQEPADITVPAGGAVVRVIAVAAGVVGAVYTAQLAASALGTAQGQILDSVQVLGVTAPQAGAADTRVLSHRGIYVSTSLTVQAIQGTLSGVLYVTDFDAHEEMGEWRRMKYTNSP